MSTHERSDATAYLLGELDAEQAAAFERALAGDAALRDEVERLRPVISRLERLPTEAWESEEPPPLRLPDAALGESAPAAEGFTAPAAPAPATAPEPSPSGPTPPAARRSRRGWLRGPLVLRPALAAVLAALLLAGGVGIGALLDDGSGGDAGTSVASTEPPLTLKPIGDDPAAHGRVLVARGAQPHVTLRVGGLAPSRAREFYELWLLGRDGQLVALGSFRIDRSGATTLRLPLPVDPTDFSAFDISVQPQDGDASHSGDSVLRGPTRI